MSLSPTTVRATLHDGSLTSLPPAFPAKRIALGVASLSIAAFAIALTCTIPATLVSRALKVDAALPVSGTIWSGEMTLDGGDRLIWTTDVLGSILSLSAIASLSVNGELTELNARASMRGSRATLSDISGVAGWSLVKTFLPHLAFDCDVGIRFESATIVVNDNRMSLSGRALSGPGPCINNADAKSFDMPAAEAVASTADGASQIRITLASDPSALLADVAIASSGDIQATVQPLALKLLTGATASGPVVYEMRSL